ncbi:F-box protein At5g67140-like isoform X2 [Andrographis paniculata]|uniref:F-box protein At5g67140-like isoform X2 n=1 Tax=Andrographis paniculata TaxID=175694 RepID=UPI0021E892F6|nr:F-box protein At5g67140-like isoform X2 [Andrographis paniculata]
MAGADEAAIDCLPVDLLAHIFCLITCFKDLAQVCTKWRQGVEQSLARRESLSFSGWKMDDESTARLVNLSYGLKELDISRSRWGCQITDRGIEHLSKAKCISNLSSISLWGSTAITDNGVIQLISRTNSLRHLNIGGTFITDASLFAIAESCPNLKSLVLWGCRQVSEIGLVDIVNKCQKLESINVWGMRVPLDCFLGLLTIRPSLRIKPEGVLLSDYKSRTFIR